MRLLLILALLVIFMPREGIDREALIARVGAAVTWATTTCDRDPQFCEETKSTFGHVLHKTGEALAMMEGAVRRNLAASNLGRMPEDGRPLDAYAISSVDTGAISSSIDPAAAIEASVAAAKLAEAFAATQQAPAPAAPPALAPESTLLASDFDAPWQGRLPE